MAKKKKLKGKAKQEFISKMAKGKAKKKGKKKSKSKRNPSVKSVTRKAKPLFITALGVLGGTFIGAKLAELADRYAISRLPGGAIQGLGWIAACMAALYGGKKLQPMAKQLPIIAGSIALCVPFALGAFSAVGVVPLGLVAAAPPPALPLGEPVQEGWRYTKRMDPRAMTTGMGGRLLEGRAPGSQFMAGTMQPGRAPGSPVMEGWFGGDLPRDTVWARGNYAQPI